MSTFEPPHSLNKSSAWSCIRKCSRIAKELVLITIAERRAVMSLRLICLSMATGFLTTHKESIHVRSVMTSLKLNISSTSLVHWITRKGCTCPNYQCQRSSGRTYNQNQTYQLRKVNNFGFLLLQNLTRNLTSDSVPETRRVEEGKMCNKNLIEQLKTNVTLLEGQLRKKDSEIEAISAKALLAGVALSQRLEDDANAAKETFQRVPSVFWWAKNRRTSARLLTIKIFDSGNNTLPKWSSTLLLSVAQNG